MTFLLSCAAQNYKWGKIGADSEVAQLLQSGYPEKFKIDEGEMYAELWMGTHVKGPSQIAETGESLSLWLKDNPKAVGSYINEKYDSTDLPFLLKVLSVNKALSIQAHPNKAHAKELHAADPEHYPDPNHKPEMAIALTPFEGLCGFRPLEEIIFFTENIPELRAVLYDNVTNDLKSSSTEEDVTKILQKSLSKLMTQDSETVAANLASLTTKYSATDAGDEIYTKFEMELFLRLNQQFPGDVGCFCIYFLNHMMLQPGEAMFLEANLPHAYLSGDCIECMACSDNVVRAGLTPKFKDVPTLVNMLKYKCRKAEENLFPGVPLDETLTRYNPGVDDFCVDRAHIKPGTTSYRLESLPSASILLMVRGKADLLLAEPTRAEARSHMCVQRGHVVFVSANQSVQLNAVSQDVLLFRAYARE